MVFTSDGRRNKGVDTWIGKANATLRELLCSVVMNRELSKSAKLQFLNGSLFLSSPVVMNLRWGLKEYCLKNKRQRWDICREFSVWHFVTKYTDLKSVKPGMSSHFSDSRYPRYITIDRILDLNWVWVLKLSVLSDLVCILKWIIWVGLGFEKPKYVYLYKKRKYCEEYLKFGFTSIVGKSVVKS